MPPRAGPGASGWIARHVMLVDLVTAALLAGASIGPDISRGNTWPWWVLPAAACFVPLAWRRRRPVPAAAAIAVAALVLVAGGALVGSGFAAMWVAVYSVAVRGPRRQ